MQVVYIDSLLILNFLLDDLLLALTGRVAGAAQHRGRIALAALIGSLYAGAVVLWPGLGFLGHPLVRISAGVGMVLLAYGGARRLGRLILLFFALSAALGGGLYALTLLGMGVWSVHGVAVPPPDLKLVLLFAAVSYALFSLVGKKLARHSAGELRRVEVRQGDKEVRLTALVDSGNTLTDPMTGAGVLVAEAERLQSLLPPEADCRRPAQCFPHLREPRRFRLLPYKAVGVDGGLLLAMRADAVVVDGKNLGSRLVALSPTAVSDGGGYQALLGDE